MSLRAFISSLAAKSNLSSSRVQAVGSAAGRSGARRTLHPNSLNPVHSDVGRSRLLKSAVAAATLSAFAGIWYFKEHTDYQSASGVIDDEKKAIMELTDKKAMTPAIMEPARSSHDQQGSFQQAGKPDQNPSNEGDDMDEQAAIKAMFVDEAGNFYCPGYLDYISSQRLNDNRPYKKSFSGNKNAINEVTDDDIMEDLNDDEEEEAAMKARFEVWMEQHGRRYKNEEEKAMRYGRFKKVARFADKRNASKPSGACLDGPNNLADLTEEEFRWMDGRQGEFDWEGYLDRVNSLIAQGRVHGHQQRHEVIGSEAVKQKRNMEVAAAKGRRQSDKL